MESAGSEPLSKSSPSPPPVRDEGGKRDTLRRNRNSIIPPYWQRHEPSDSSHSLINGADPSRPAPILLEDHTQAGSEQCKALWAKHVTIDDYVIVSGTAPGLGAYVVWNCTVETLDVSLSETRGGGVVLPCCTCRLSGSYRSSIWVVLTRVQGGPMKIIKRFVSSIRCSSSLAHDRCLQVF